MDIVHIPRRFTRQDWGGTETVVLETCKRLLRMGHRTEILCPNALAQNDYELIDGVPVRRVSYFYPYWRLRPKAKRQLDKKGGNLFSFALMKALWKYPHLDLIHLHTMKRLGGIGRYVARQRGIPYVVSLHGGVYDVPAEEAQSWTAPTQGAIEWGKVLGWWVGSRRVLADAAAILCVGQREQEETQRRYPHKRVIHLPNGVDPDRFAHGDGAGFRLRYGIPLTAHVILTMGRIDPQKNQRLAIRVLPELLKTDPHLHLLLIGPVTNDAYYRQLVDEMRWRGIEAHVTIIPGLDAGSQDLVDAYHAADVFLLPSIHEPFGIVILEAWAAGRPVVASRVGGVPSFVVHGRDGLLFDPHDERACRQAIHEMLTHPQRRRSLAEAGCAKARHEYSWDRITERLVAIYREVIDENSLRQRKMWVLRWRRTEYC